jgi:hypothetical protein
VRTLSEVKMVEDSTMAVAELVGITRNPDGQPHFDNLVVRCLVNIRTLKGETELYGACRETDADGDSTSTTFDSKAHYFIGGTGKYKGITGTAPFTVQALKSPGEGLGVSSSRTRSPGGSREVNERTPHFGSDALRSSRHRPKRASQPTRRCVTTHWAPGSGGWYPAGHDRNAGDQVADEGH